MDDTLLCYVDDFESEIAPDTPTVLLAFSRSKLFGYVCNNNRELVILLATTNSY